jgi:ATP-dependent RNA helicase DeaD
VETFSQQPPEQPAEEPAGQPAKRRRRRKRSAKKPAAATTPQANLEAAPEAVAKPRTAAPSKRSPEAAAKPRAAAPAKERPEPEAPAKQRRTPSAKQPPAAAAKQPSAAPAKERTELPAKQRPAAPAASPAAAAAKKQPEAAAKKQPEAAAKQPPAAPQKKQPEATTKQPSAAPAPAKTPRKLPAVGGFADMGLSTAMLDVLAAAEYLQPTPVQVGVIPRALAGVDVMAQARTGTGKTAAFAIPILERLEPHRKGGLPQALVLAPTRELAVQVRDECVKLAAGQAANIVALYGGKPIRSQTEHLRDGAEMIVGTPGRVLDLLSRGSLMLGELRWVVLDEADRMLDIGFRPDIEKILRRCPQSRQTLLLSATIPPPVKRLAERYMREPEMLDFSTKDLAVETIEQFYFSVEPERKFELLVQLIQREQPKQAIIFCRTRRGTERVQQRLSKLIDSVDTIHGDLQQNARDRAMRRFREGKVTHLVATDVVGRGIDVTNISHIINYDIPQFCDDYVHRVGRAGRMGREGVAYTFVTPEEGNELTRIEMRINRLLARAEIPGFVALSKPEPTGDLDEEEEVIESPVSKPVFGSRSRRYRRAL